MINSAYIDYYSKNMKKGILEQNSYDLYVNYLLAYYCMPTLVHIKPANLIQLNKKKYKDTNKLILIIENYLKKYNCSCLCVYEDEMSLSLLVYNKLLANVLSDIEITNYFLNCGYEIHDDKVGSILDTWKQRYVNYNKIKCDNSCFSKVKTDNIDTRTLFPHEIGLILGYPLEDVKAFIYNQGQNYLLCGYWKVYHNTESAMKIFEAYNRVRSETLEILHQGGSLINKKEVERNMIKLDTEGEISNWTYGLYLL